MPQSSHTDALKVQASPTKEFFIEMLTKDVALVPAIIDLVDNSVDGARRERRKGDFNGLYVHITAKPSSFAIDDNCGGIPVDLARDYAFRFGRPEKMEGTKHSIGQFGVGMKRALFKLGSQFRVESATRTSRFSVMVNVAEWRADPNNWNFAFEVEPRTDIRVPASQVGTRIRVLALRDSAMTELEGPRFESILRRELERRHSPALARGLRMRVNDMVCVATAATLLQSRGVRPAFAEFSLTSRRKDDVQVRLYAGLGESVPAEAGWYVFCNDRMVLGPDQTNVTGWGESGAASTKVPRYHNQFADFRGYVFMDADDAVALPWTTTKTGVEVEHPVYQAARRRMIAAMRPVIDFLNKLKEEMEGKGKEAKGPSGTGNQGPLEGELSKAEPVPLSRIKEAGQFRYPPVKKAATHASARICYEAPRPLVDAVKRDLGVSTNADVGLKTFDYYVKTALEEE